MASLTRLILIGSLLLLLPLCMQAAQAQEKFKLIHSDQLNYNKLENEQILELRGKVHFWYGDTEFKSDRAMIFDVQKIARLMGNVTVINDSLELKADSVAYYRFSEELNLGGKVRVTERRQSGSLRWFASQYAVYNRKEDKLTAWQDVSSWDKDENAHASCGYAFWDRDNGYAYMIENPMLSAGEEDTLYIKADKIEYFDEGRKIVATFNVNVQSSDYQITSDFLIYLMDEEKAVFTGMPEFASEYAIATADEFYLFFDERKLDKAELQDNCRVYFAQEKDAPKESWVTANYIAISFREEGIDNFSAEEDVEYFFHQTKERKQDEFFNSAKGFYLEAKFNDDNKLEWMQMDQQVKGIYKFHNNP